jgi:hypothetical protein
VTSVSDPPSQELVVGDDLDAAAAVAVARPLDPPGDLDPAEEVGLGVGGDAGGPWGMAVRPRPWTPFELGSLWPRVVVVASPVEVVRRGFFRLR